MAFILFVSIVGQVLKTRLLTRELTRKVRLLFWLQKVYPILLLLLGVLPGLTFPGEVVPGVSTTGSKIWFFIGCAGISILGFNIFKEWIKAKLEVKHEKDHPVD
jgi:hypothetical protein